MSDREPVALAVPADPLTIVHVVTQREPAGAQRVAHQLCQSMRGHGHRSDVWFLYPREPAFVGESYVDIRAQRPGPLATLGLLVQLVRMLHHVQPDVVVAHTHHANALASLAGRLAGVPRRVVVHHTLAQYESRTRRTIMATLRLTRTFHEEVFVSETTRGSYGPRARRRGTVIHNGVDAPGAPHPWRGDPRKQPSQALLVSIGRLVPQKDHATLIDAMSAIPGADLAIIGAGDLEADLSRQIARLGLGDRVTLIGNIEPHEVSDALGAADVVVLPSTWEAFGMLVLEAMASGKAMVVSDIPSHREALGDVAEYHPVGDSAAVAARVCELLADDARRLDLASRARERSQEFTLEHTVAQYLALVRA